MDTNPHERSGAYVPTQEEISKAVVVRTKQQDQARKVWKDGQAKLIAEMAEYERIRKLILAASVPGQSINDNPVCVEIAGRLSDMAARAAAHREATNGGELGEKPSRAEIRAVWSIFASRRGTLPSLFQDPIDEMGLQEWVTKHPSILDFIIWPTDGTLVKFRAYMERIAP